MSIVGKELKKERKKNHSLIELVKRHKPTDEQENIFKKYRAILKNGDEELMPHKIHMYTAENIKIEKTLGAGAYGEVFKGTVSSDHFGEKIEKEIALKQLHIKNNKGTETTLLSFVTEVRNLAAVGSHENIVPFFGVAWRENAFPSIVLEFVAGGDLNSYIEEYKYGEDEAHGLGSPTLLSIALGIIKGVHHIHDKGMIHRDLKPQNVLLDCSDASKAPVPKIADFGESRDETNEMTMTYVGTQWYIAPEIYRGERYSSSADIFSLGVVLNQIDTLQSPGKGVQLQRNECAGAGELSSSPSRRGA